MQRFAHHGLRQAYKSVFCVCVGGCGVWWCGSGVVWCVHVSHHHLMHSIIITFLSLASGATLTSSSANGFFLPLFVLHFGCVSSQLGHCYPILPSPYINSQVQLCCQNVVALILGQTGAQVLRKQLHCMSL